MKILLMIPAMLLFLGTASAQKTAPTKPVRTEKHAVTAPATAKPEMIKEHTCTAACVDGKHMHAHGEKGHACSEACMKMHSSGMKGHEGHDHGEMKGEMKEMKEEVKEEMKEMKEEMKEAKGEMKEEMKDAKGEMMEHKGEMKAHACTAACKDGKHAFAHGEKGHTCDASCHNMRQPKK